MANELKMLRSEAIDRIAAALAAAQGELPNPIKANEAGYEGRAKPDKPGSGGRVEYKYPDLAEALEDIRPILSKHKIAILQPTYTDGGLLRMETLLMHESGQYLGSDYLVCSIKTDDPRTMGSAITYARRYTLFPLLGIHGERDDDAAAADAAGRRPPKAPPVDGGSQDQRPPKAPATEAPPEKTPVGQAALKAVQEAKTKAEFDEAIAKARDGRARMSKTEEDAIAALAKKRKAEFEAAATPPAETKPPQEEGEGSRAAREYYELLNDLKNCKSPDECDDFMNAFKEKIDRLPKWYGDKFQAAFDKHRDGEI